MPKPKDESDEEVKAIVDGLMAEFGVADQAVPAPKSNGAPSKPGWSTGKKGARAK
jgi:hypothetical protein